MIKNQIPSNFEVSGYVKTGAWSSILKNTASVEVRNLTKKDFVIIWYGSNDVSSNNTSSGVRNILQLVMNNSHMNIIVVNVPYRYDILESSYVNGEVALFNRKLEKYLKLFNWVTLLTTDCSRSNFTKHGMHLNNLRKSNASKQIVKCILETMKEVPKALITLDWKSVYDPSVNDILMCEGNQTPVPIRNSKSY
jgi:hypothetical protein